MVYFKEIHYHSIDWTMLGIMEPRFHFTDIWIPIVHS